MDEIWMRMASRYGHAWVSQYGAEPDGIAAAEWRDTLAELTAAQIHEGFDADRSRGEQWPPSSTQFRSMCLGIPSLASIREEISQLSDSYGNPIVSRFARGVWSRISTYNYRNGTGKQQERMLRDAFDLTRTFVMEGGTLPVNPVGYIAPAAKETHKPASPDVVKSHIDKIADLLKTDPVKPYTEVENDSAA